MSAFGKQQFMRMRQNSHVIKFLSLISAAECIAGKHHNLHSCRSKMFEDAA